MNPTRDLRPLCRLREDDLAAQRELVGRLREALGKAKETICVWHDMGGADHGFDAEYRGEMWRLYQESPEMREINAALAAPPPRQEAQG
jgi:pimeloyl-ACP methyl ester carboxylesterase